MRRIGRIIGNWAGAAILFVLEHVLVAILFVVVTLAQVASFVWRFFARLFGAPAPAPPSSPESPDGEGRPKD
jgi:hypothetical protein